MSEGERVFYDLYVSSDESIEFDPVFPGLHLYGDLFARSEANLAASVVEGATDERKSSPVRRTFLLIVVIDFLLVCIIWFLYLRIASPYADQSLAYAIKEEIVHLRFESSMFDAVVISFIRFLILEVVYGCVKSDKPWCAALVTGVSTLHVILKIIFFEFHETKNGGAFAYFLLIVLILVPWVETIFLEYRVFPKEKAAIGVYRHLRPNHSFDGRSTRSRRFRSNYAATEYRTPEGSIEDLQVDLDDAQLLEKESAVDVAKLLEMGRSIQRSATLVLDDASWVTPGREFADPTSVGKVHVRHAAIAGYKCKMSRLDGVIRASPLVVFRELVEGIDSSSAWNPLLSSAKRIQRFPDQSMDVVYTVVEIPGKGLVNSRDFVFLRNWGENADGGYYIASSSIEHPKCPVMQGVTRAHQYINATHITAVEGASDLTRFSMVVCSDMKMWCLPSFLETATKASLERLFHCLQNHLQSYCLDQNDYASQGCDPSHIV